MPDCLTQEREEREEGRGLESASELEEEREKRKRGESSDHPSHDTSLSMVTYEERGSATQSPEGSQAVLPWGSRIDDHSLIIECPFCLVREKG